MGSWTVTKEHHEHMAMRQRQNLVSCEKSDAEAWMLGRLSATRLKWTRQARWGFRLFDFWCHRKGLAVEVDGREHNKAADAERDEIEYHRSGIVVLRVSNFNETEADSVIDLIGNAGSRNSRRESLGLRPIANAN